MRLSRIVLFPHHVPVMPQTNLRLEEEGCAASAWDLESSGLARVRSPCTFLSRSSVRGDKLWSSLRQQTDGPFSHHIVADFGGLPTSVGETGTPGWAAPHGELGPDREA